MGIIGLLQRKRVHSDRFTLEWNYFPMAFMFYTVYLEDLNAAMNLVYMEVLSSKYYGSSINPSNC